MDEATWQNRFDTDFPHGLLATWRGQTGPEDPMYRIPRPQVIGSDGEEPVVRLDVWDTEKSFIIRITDYQLVEEHHPRRARITGAGYATAMYWSANISDELRRAMTPDRTR